MRIVRHPDGTLAPGRTLPGRGAWLCAGSPTCLERAGRHRAFERALGGEVAPGAVEALAQRLAEGPAEASGAPPG